MKMLKFLFVLLVCQTTLSAQKSIDSEEQLLQALFLDIPVEADVAEIITHIDTRNDLIKEDLFDDPLGWLFEKHTLIEIEQSENMLFLSKDDEGWDSPKIWMEINSRERNHPEFKKEYKRLKKSIEKRLLRVNKEKVLFSRWISAGEKITYHSKKISPPYTIKLSWLQSKCTRAYWIEIEYWENISNQQRIYSERSNVPEK